MAYPQAPHRNAALHAVAPRISAPRDDKEDTCTETHTQCVWTKIGWPRLEQVYGQRHEEHRVQAQCIRPMPILSGLHHISRVH